MVRDHDAGYSTGVPGRVPQAAQGQEIAQRGGYRSYPPAALCGFAASPSPALRQWMWDNLGFDFDEWTDEELRW